MSSKITKDVLKRDKHMTGILKIPKVSEKPIMLRHYGEILVLN